MTADAGHLEKAGGAEDSFETYLYLITHDLRACFRALKTIPVWIAEDLNNAEVPAEVYAHLEMLTTQALRGDRMLIDLREFSRVGRLSSPPVTEDIRSIAERCWKALSPPDTVELDLDQAEGAVTLPHEDATRLFSALLENAVKHRDRPEGHVRIVSSSEPDARIRIEDDGPGIPEAAREAALRPFERLDQARNQDRGGGVGLGLSIAADVARAHGGVLRLDTSETLGGLRADLVVAR